MGTTLKIKIGDNCDLRYATFSFFGNNNKIVLNRGGVINAGQKSMTVFQVGNDSTIDVGEGFLFSNSIVLCTTDFHPVIDIYTEKRINPDKGIRIGNHVWIGRKAYVSKGVVIPNNSIVGAYSVVTKSFEKENVIIAGNPAIVKKENINWRQ